MTDLDDALNTPTPTYHPPDLIADWQETSASTDPNGVNVLTDQMTGTYSVTHSLDDGLPDPVTMTNSNDASGTFDADLVGRGEFTADVMGWRSASTSNGTTATSIVYTHPSDAIEGDQLFLAVTVNSLTAVLTPSPLDNFQAWQLVSVIDDSPWKTWVFTRTDWANSPNLPLVSSIAVNYSAVCTAAYAQTANGSTVGLTVGTPVAIAETVSQTTHTTPTVTLDRRGYVLAVWSTSISAAPWSAGAGSTELNEATGISSATMVAVTPLKDAGKYTVSGVSTLATAVATIQGIPVLINDRPLMDARSYFSPFNKRSPVYGFDRDTAETSLTFNVLTESGVEGTILHKGQMVDIAIKGRTAEFKAMSKTRLDLDRSVTLPVVSGTREGCSVDWLATWLMAKGGQFVGPGPTASTRLWTTMYGSTHSHMESPLTYNYGVFYDTNLTPSGPYGLKPPSVVEGPFLTGLYACQTSERTESVRLAPFRPNRSREVFPHVEPYHRDFMSLASSSGRMTFWLRGDGTANAPAYLPGGENFLFKHRIHAIAANGTYLGSVQINVRAHDRHLDVTMGSDATGFSGIVFSSGLSLPLQTDNNWHFYGIAWDYAAGTVKVKKDSQESSSSYWLTNGYNNTAGLRATDQALEDSGGRTWCFSDFHVPVSDVIIETGPEAYAKPWTDYYPTPSVGQNATMRPTYQEIKAVAESTPVHVWDTLAKLAQSTMSAYRTNENDGYEFLPLDYFGEPEQLTSTMVADTDVNAGDLDVVHDASRTRNMVTIQYDETRVDTNYSPVLTITSAVEIQPGITTVIFPLDTPVIEIHGQADPLGADWNIYHLSEAQRLAPSTIPTNIHYMTINTVQEGTGVAVPYIGGSSFIGRIVDMTGSTVTIRFTNKYNKPIWLANNADQLPFLRILGYAVRTTDGYVTSRDAGSIGFRRERPLDVELPWVHTRETAQKISGWMVTALARPRPQVAVEVMGDPRRTPGQLITLADAEGTQAEGTWRVLKIDHNAADARYTQSMSLVAVLPVAVWDELPGWDETIWAP